MNFLTRQNPAVRWFNAASIALALAGCAANTPTSDSGNSLDGSSSDVTATAATPQGKDNAPLEAGVAAKAAMFLGTDKAIEVPGARPGIKLDGEAVMLNFEQAPLNEVIHTILGDTLGLDYVIENQVPGEITLRTRSPIPRDELLPILESLLRNNNVLMIRGPGDRFFISGSPSIRSTVPAFSANPGAGFSNVIVPLQYIGAAEMAEILKPVAREDAFVRIDQGRNLLVLAGTQIQLEGWLDIVATFDVDQLAGKSVGIFPLANSTVEDVFPELEHILSSASDDGQISGIAGLVRVMPVERLNSIMVVSPRAHYVESVRRWIEELDSVQDAASEPTLQVYPVRNGNAGQLASLLSTIYGGGGNSGARGGVAPGMAQASSGSGAGVSGAMPKRGGGNKTSGGSFSLGDDVRVVSDDMNNTLLVYATPYEYQKIERILIKLDVVATQVLIEASIVEVTLRDDLEYGLEWAFDNNLGGGDSGRGLLNLGGNLQPQAGFSYTVTNSAGAVKAVLNALAEESLINVISTPSVLVLDNHTAAIHVGDQQPIQSQSTVTNGGNVQNSITYKDTGVKLQVTPSVNDGGLVTLDIDQSVTDVGPVDAATRQRSFLERNVSSRVAVRSGESVVLGGLIRDNETEGKSGVPLLMNIPVVGSLFSTTTTASTRTELLIFITPRVMENEQDLRDLNSEMRARMRGLTDFDDLPLNLGNAADQ
ncbi:type II secretion system secretin GspD [Luminiphilus sp.]|nr:type II secretion system secretin GspD [Luminiphilus sp.]MDA9711211.1 type II secretion system secretin GspD [Luminiphilus sp.]